MSEAHPDTITKPAPEHCSCLRHTLTPHQSLPGSTARVWGLPWHHIKACPGALLVSEAHPDTTSKPTREHCSCLRPALTPHQSLPGSTARVWGLPWHHIKACPGALLVSKAYPDTTSKPAREHCSCLRPALTPHQSLPESTARVWGLPWHHIKACPGALLVSEACPDTTSKPAREHCLCLRPTLTLYQSLPGSTARVWGPPWHYIKACLGALLVSEAHPDTISKPAWEHCLCLRPTLTPHQSLPGSTPRVWGPHWPHIKACPGALLVSEAHRVTGLGPSPQQGDNMFFVAVYWTARSVNIDVQGLGPTRH